MFIVIKYTAIMIYTMTLTLNVMPFNITCDMVNSIVLTQTMVVHLSNSKNRKACSVYGQR